MTKRFYHEILKFSSNGVEFVNIALGYAQFYQPKMDIETFVEYVEEAEEIQKMQKEIVNPSDLTEAFKIFDEDEAI